MKLCQDCTNAGACWHDQVCRMLTPMQRVAATKTDDDAMPRLDWVRRPLHAVYDMDPSKDTFGAIQAFRCPECDAEWPSDGPGYIAATEHVATHEPKSDAGTWVGQRPCPHGDPHCPCQDGDPCHYVATDKTHAMDPQAALMARAPEWVR